VGNENDTKTTEKIMIICQEMNENIEYKAIE